MNRADAAQILAVLSAPHGFTTEPDTMEVWYQAALQQCDTELATEVAIRLVETEERFPTPARFNKERGIVERLRYAEANEAATQQALAEMPKSNRELAEDARRKFFTDMRAMLVAQAANLDRHDHHGPAPCPVCGGINPDVLARMDDDALSACELRQQVIWSEQDRRHGVAR